MREVSYRFGYRVDTSHTAPVLLAEALELGLHIVKALRVIRLTISLQFPRLLRSCIYCGALLRAPQESLAVLSEFDWIEIIHRL